MKHTAVEDSCIEEEDPQADARDFLIMLGLATRILCQSNKAAAYVPELDMLYLLWKMPHTRILQIV
jgi:hypothetical protein